MSSPAVDRATGAHRHDDPAPAAMVPHPFRVVRTRQDNDDTATLWLEPVATAPFDFAPGQFTMLHAFGVGEVPVSVSGDPGDPGVLQHTVRDVGAVSHALATAPVGTVLGVRGPFGSGWDAGSGRGGDLVVVAGGIGLAPLRPAVLEVCADRAAFGRVVVLYGARSPDDLLFTDDLVGWSRDHDVDVQVIVDNGRSGWSGPVGLVTRLVARAEFTPSRATALVCGPEVMMRFSAAALLDRGVPASRIRLSMERNMKCGVGLCGHCQLRELLLCVDGPVLGYDVLAPLMARAEL